jgi:DNA helicase-2/ATP-dependent DNA helicase PcrA
MTKDLTKDLNKQQLEAVTFPDSPLMILAGAGSGKTRVLTYRAAYIIENAKSSTNLLLLTFTNKAAEEMQSRLSKLVGETAPFSGTFHRFCALFLRKQGHLLGLPINYQIYDDSDQQDVIKHIFNKLNLTSKQYRPGTFLSQIHQAKNELIGPKAYGELAQGNFQHEVAQVYHLYQQKLLEAEAVDFDDLLLFTVKILQNFPEVAKSYQNHFSHLLVDEYQDTNKAQYVIVKSLAAGHHHLTVVGDAAQSIYRWRGADYRNLDYLKRDFSELATIKLEQNYRSTQPILDAAYSVISHNSSHPILSLWTNEKTGDPITLFEADDESMEALHILSVLKDSPPDTTSAVLYRTNAQSRALEEACIHAGVPYVLVGGTKFYDRKEIKDLLAYLRLVYNPKDFVSHNRAEKIGKRKLKAFETMLPKLNSDQTPTDIFDQIVKATDYLSSFDAKIEADLSRLENIKELRGVTTKFTTLSEFLENVALVDNQTVTKDASAAHTKPLTLMTIHAAKGLEFDQVFLVGLEEGLFPHSRSLMEPAELEEERRLCYVAMTRARKKLHLSFAHHRLSFGSFQTGVVSRFIREIPEHTLHFVGITTKTSHSNSKAPKLNFDDPSLDLLLSDEIDIDEFLNS